MSHGKVSLQGSIPFSWEHSPGVSKIIHRDHPLDGRSQSHIGAIPLSSPSSPKSQPHSLESSSKDTRIPLPPCPNLQPHRRSSSLKGFRWWQDDPFFAAYKECTKNGKSCGKESSEGKKIVGNRVRKTKLTFSCKNSCEVKEDNLLRPSKSNFHSIPNGSVQGKYLDIYGDSHF